MMAKFVFYGFLSFVLGGIFFVMLSCCYSFGQKHCLHRRNVGQAGLHPLEGIVGELNLPSLASPA
jgi:hypothetical protein